MQKRVKVEGGAKCVKGVAKAAEDAAKKQAEFTYKIGKAPKEVKKFYESGLKNLKTSKSAEKQEFIEHVLSGDFKSEYFKRCQKVERVTESKEEETWMSWKQITAVDGEALVKAQIAQGKIETRKHARLDHEHPSTKALPEEEQLEYQRVQD